MKQPNLKILGIEGEEYQLKGIENIQQNHRKLSQSKEGNAYKGTKAYRTPNILDLQKYILEIY